MVKETDEFADIIKELEESDKKREEIIPKAREIVKQSKTAIYALQRGDLKTAASVLAVMKKSIAELKPYSEIAVYAGTIKPAIQEYVEAACFNEFVLTGKMLPRKELGISAEHYVAGLCDLSGEIVRKAINAAINDDPKLVINAKKFVENLYYGLLQLDLRNGELRKKFDGIKYDLKKLEDVVLSLKLQRKI
jgi:predicted translin family RNA/ssDNA-binding protein